MLTTLSMTNPLNHLKRSGNNSKDNQGSFCTEHVKLEFMISPHCVQQKVNAFLCLEVILIVGYVTINLNSQLFFAFVKSS